MIKYLISLLTRYVLGCGTITAVEIQYQIDHLRRRYHSAHRIQTRRSIAAEIADLERMLH